MGLEAVFADGNIVDAPGNLQLALGGFGHALLVDGQGDDGGVVLAGKGEDFIRFGAPGFQVGGVDQAATGGGLQGKFHHLGLGAVDDEGHAHGRSQGFDQAAHQLAFVGTLGEGGAQIQSVGAGFNLGAGDLQRAFEVFGQDHLFKLSAALGVEALTDEEGRGFLNHGLGRGGRGQARLARGRVGLGGFSAQAVHQQAHVLGGRAAATADDAHTEFLDVGGERVGKGLGLQGVNCLTVHVEGQPGVGDAGYGQVGGLGELAQRLAHIIGAGGAVEADGVDGEVFEDGGDSGTVGAQEHAPGGVESDLGLDGQIDAGLLKGGLNADDDGFDLQNVLGGFDEEQVHAAGDQRGGLLPEDVDQFGKGNIGELGIAHGGQFAGGAERPSHQALLPGFLRVLVGQAAGQLRGGAVDGVHLVLQTVFSQSETVGAECVGFDHIHTGIQEGAVHGFDCLRGGDDQVIVTAVGALAAKINSGEVELLQAGAHCPVKNQYFLIEQVKIFSVGVFSSHNPSGKGWY